jgi:cell wall-associated NlpC family hydrolase
VTLAELVGIPHRTGGRERDGADCWGLVLLAYAGRGIELPAYNDPLRGCARTPAGFLRERVAAEARRAWELVAVAEARPFDVVLLTGVRPEDHVAIVTEDPAWVLTTNRGLGAYLSRWGRGSRWEGRCDGLYRYRGPGAELLGRAPQLSGLGSDPLPRDPGI